MIFFLSILAVVTATAAAVLPFVESQIEQSPWKSVFTRWQTRLFDILRVCFSHPLPSAQSPSLQSFIVMLRRQQRESVRSFDIGQAVVRLFFIQGFLACRLKRTLSQKLMETIITINIYVLVMIIMKHNRAIDIFFFLSFSFIK